MGRQQSEGEGSMARAVRDELMLDAGSHFVSCLGGRGPEWNRVNTCERNCSSAAVHIPVHATLPPNLNNQACVSQPNRQRLNRQQPLVAFTHNWEPHSHDFEI